MEVFSYAKMFFKSLNVLKIVVLCWFLVTLLQLCQLHAYVAISLIIIIVVFVDVSTKVNHALMHVLVLLDH